MIYTDIAALSGGVSQYVVDGEDVAVKAGFLKKCALNAGALSRCAQQWTMTSLLHLHTLITVITIAQVGVYCQSLQRASELHTHTRDGYPANRVTLSCRPRLVTRKCLLAAAPAALPPRLFPGEPLVVLAQAKFFSVDAAISLTRDLSTLVQRCQAEALPGAAATCCVRPQCPNVHTSAVCTLAGAQA